LFVFLIFSRFIYFCFVNAGDVCRFFRIYNVFVKIILKYFLFSSQDWFAFLGNGSEFNFTLVGEAFFPNTGNPSSDDNYGFCQVSSVI